jgi:MerR family transcriptional regulator, thiopeptide resistance regulator
VVNVGTVCIAHELFLHQGIPLDSDPGSGISIVKEEEPAGLYRIHEFAQLAGVTVKALHHYDRLGLLKPRRSGAGYRLYAEHDLARLEQIVALKFLGLPLKQIKILLDRDNPQLPEALRLQRTVLEEKRLLLDRAICAIVNAEQILQSGKQAGAAAIKRIIEAMEMQTEFMKNYYREEAWVHFKARHREWPSREWIELFRAIQSALTEGPAGDRAQSLAARWRKLRVSDSGGDPKIHEGLIKAWGDRQYWPAAVQDQFSEFDLAAVSDFIAKIFGAYRQRRFGDIVWVRDLDGFTAEEKERFTLATVDLFFKIDEALSEDPGGETGQALAARWMELVESRTGSFNPSQPGFYESYLQWMDSWPAPLHRKIRALNLEKIGAFMLQAITHPM